jgi:5-methylcytosine-specific restriction endonuclease McrA
MSTEYPYPGNWGSIRGEIIERDNGECRECGSETNLEVHHKDRNQDNNNKSNLITLCTRCHTKEHHPLQDRSMPGSTTIAVDRKTRNRLGDLKPYESMSYDDMIQVLMDEYEVEQ